MAGLMECTAPKPGNVHPGAAFDDLCYDDFVKSAEVVAPIIARARDTGVGRCVLEAIRATNDAVGRNTNLGIVLLLAPLASIPLGVPLAEGIGDVLASLTVDDAELVYEAIRLISPGGMGQVDDGDVAGKPTGTLLEMMRLAADRDAIAAEYATGFQRTLGFGLATIERLNNTFANDWKSAVVRLHLELMAAEPDTLIARKLGREVALESQRRAKSVLSDEPLSRERLAEFDDWLRTDGHRCNPGTTADLVTACLFAGLREGDVSIPSEFDRN